MTDTNTNLQTFSVEGLRVDLALKTQSQKLFPIGEKGDATEALIYILEALHGEFPTQKKPCSCAVHKSCQTMLNRILKCRICNTISTQ